MNNLSRYASLTFAIGVAALSAGGVRAGNLIADGGFESPASTTPGYQSGYVAYDPGQTFGGAWTVTGSGSNVALTNTGEYTDGPSYYDAHSGQQWLDLTGTLDNGSIVGVSQSVSTTLGKTYDLSFWVGTAPDAESAVELVVNGVDKGSFANPTPGVYGGQFVNWEQFSTSFTGAGGPESIQFNYAGGNSVDGLDDVVLTAGVPEPMSWMMMILGAAGVGAAARGRRRAQSAPA